MTSNLNTVKIERAYHHGELRAALIDAAEAVLGERGIEGFSLRETARRAGVSPAAPKHHFRDVRALLTAVAVRAFDDLAGRLRAVSEQADGGREAAIRRQGVAYVRFALDQRARFDLMWRTGLLDMEDKSLTDAAHAAFRVVDGLVRGADSEDLPKGDPRLAPTIARWSIAHGFARLALDGNFCLQGDALDDESSRLLLAVLDHVQLADPQHN